MASDVLIPTASEASAAIEDDDREYPTSDGQPMADNTKQFRWIVTIQGGLDALFADDPNVFVAGDLLWYPVRGRPDLSRAPDAMVVFGRPKGDRGAYKQWKEDNIAPQVVFEVLSPNNTPDEMADKYQFYDDHGVEEYYLYDPDGNELQGWLRQEGRLQELPALDGWVSPRLGIRFVLQDDGLHIVRPDGREFVSYVELERQYEQEHQRAEQERQRAEQERQRVEQERQRAEQERQRAEQERQRVEQEQQRAEQERQRAEQERQRAEQERQRAEHERQRAERLAARLRALGIDVDEEGS